jgi:acetyltransferase
MIMDKECLFAKTPYPHLVITPYPSRYIKNWKLTDGTDVVLRPIRPEDEPLEHEMFTSLSAETLRARFYQTITNITHKMHVMSCNIDYDREMSFVAEIRDNGRRRLIGIGRLVIENDFKKGEFAVIVHDSFHGKGLAHKLLDMLIGFAEEKGLEEFYGIVQPHNRKMINMAEKMGMIREHFSEELLKVKLRLK